RHRGGHPYRQPTPGAAVLPCSTISKRINQKPPTGTGNTDGHVRLLRKPCWPVKSGQCDKSDTALQANYTRLQPGGAVQHYQGLAGDRPNTTGAAGVYATAGKLPGTNHRAHDRNQRTLASETSAWIIIQKHGPPVLRVTAQLPM
uniref:Uncharacterized protein n=1 Tax=Anopheles minimus TaxID=112268 RepID=A0A182VUJ9_9DIPT